MFSGGSYREVERWLGNFVTSHAKRVSPAIETRLDDDDQRQERSFGARLELAGRTSSVIELDFEDVARHRGNLEWCEALAVRVSGLARELVSSGG